MEPKPSKPKKSKFKEISGEEKKKKLRDSANFYARYSSLAFQMIVIMLAGTIGGIKLDGWIGLKYPVFTIVLSLLSVFGALYYTLKDLFK